MCIQVVAYHKKQTSWPYIYIHKIKWKDAKKQCLISFMEKYFKS